MINRGFKIKAEDIKKLNELKKSQAYSSYIKGIANSPLYVGMVKEHIENIDIKSDVKRLKSEGLIPDSISESNLNDLFKTTLIRLALNIVSDAIILKELEDINIDNVISEIQMEADIVYLMGLADDKYYTEAKQMVENGIVNKNDLIFKGLMAHMAIREKIPQTANKQKPKEDITVSTTGIEIEKPEKKRKISSLNLDSKDIDL